MSVGQYSLLLLPLKISAPLPLNPLKHTKNASNGEFYTSVCLILSFKPPFLQNLATVPNPTPSLLLPPEIIIMVLLLLKWQYILEAEEEKREDWSRNPLGWIPAAQCCKYWWAIASDLSGCLWNILDLHHPYPSPQKFSELLALSQGLPLEVSFIDYHEQDLPPALIALLVPHAQRLTHLAIPSLAGCANLFTQPLSQLKTFRLINATQNPLIQSSPFPNLQTLDLDYPHPMPMPSISNLFSLTTLHLTTFNIPNNLTFLKFAQILSELSSFKDLAITEALPLIPVLPGSIGKPFPLKTLTHLNLYDRDAERIETFINWFSFPEHMQLFKLGSAPPLYFPNSISHTLNTLNPAAPPVPSLFNSANHLHIQSSSLSELIITAWNQKKSVVNLFDDECKVLLDVGGW